MPSKSAEAPADKPAAPPKPTTPDGTKARRHAPTRTLKQIVADREAEQERIAQATYGSGQLRADVEYLRRHFPVTREGKMIRVGGTLRTEAQVREIAARERRLEQPAPAMLSAIATARTGRTVMPASAGSSGLPKVLPKPAAESLVCEDCGTAARLPARPVCRDCSIERTREAVTVANRRKPTPVPAPEPDATEAAPPAQPATVKAVSPYCVKCFERRTDAQPVCRFCREAVAGKPTAPAARSKVPTCANCGRPRSHTSGALCRACYLDAAKDGPKNEITADQTDALQSALHDGASIREAARRAGIASSTAYKHAASLAPPDFTCKCGQPSSHGGRCWARRGLAGPSGRSATKASVDERLTALETALAELRAHVGIGGVSR